MQPRTDDTSYGEDYWTTMDGGAGAADSTMWEDIAHAIKETYAIDLAAAVDRSGDIPVLEFGAGMGFLVRHLRRRGFDAWGVDISQYALDHAHPEAVEYLRWFDMEAPTISQFTDGSFRLALCFETMEHIHEDRVPQALAHIHRHLAPDSRALFGICTATRPGWDSDPTHVTIRSRAWWQQTLIAAGFRPDDEAQARLAGYWLFSQHDGVFAVRRP